MQYNSIPTYEAEPFIRQETGERVPHHFAVYEIRNGERHYSFTMSNRGERFQEILKRGIPKDQARKLFYHMDEQQQEAKP